MRAERGALVVDDGVTVSTVSTMSVIAATTGDWVVLDESGACTSMLPRRTEVRRTDASRRSRDQVLAANVDLVAVVVSLSLEPDLARMERLLALAWASGAIPLILLTKADLVHDAADIERDVAAAAPGVDVLVVSGVSGEGLEDLRERVRPGDTLVLLGQSGVGKSTLVNALAGQDLVATGHVGVTGKGRHVTSSRELIRLPPRSVLLDTPGLRGVGLPGDDEGVDATFPEIVELFEGCRFGDCSHTVEPGCAVLEAVETGELPLRRLESWRKLNREAAWMARRGDARLQSEERKKWKTVHLSARRSGRNRP